MLQRKVYESELMVEMVTREERRTWMERLLSWPWRPWRATKMVASWEPRRDVLCMTDGSLVMHPEVAHLFRHMASGGIALC